LSFSGPGGTGVAKDVGPARDIVNTKSRFFLINSIILSNVIILNENIADLKDILFNNRLICNLDLMNCNLTNEIVIQLSFITQIKTLYLEGNELLDEKLINTIYKYKNPSKITKRGTRQI